MDAKNKMLTEAARLEALDALDILDTPREEIFDRITRLASRVFGVKMALVTLIDAHRQWFKSCVGFDATETPLGPSFCKHAVQSGRELVIPDARADERFADNPFVVGEPFIRFYAGIPLAPNGGVTVATFCIVDTEPRAFDREQLETLRDLARMAEMALELRKLATVDGLTGVHTRRAFREEFDRILGLGARHDYDVSLLVFDIDHFKRVNDTHGHGAGDIVLEGVAGVCRSTLRTTDFVGRMGGEEFAIALPNTDLAGAMTVAENLRKAIEAATFLADGKKLRVTASLGVTTRNKADDDLDRMLARADSALYKAKDSGRNRSVPATGDALSDDGERVLKAGRIAYNAGQSIVECTIRRQSKKRAHLKVPVGTMVPDTFDLHIEAGGARACRILERSGTTVIVAMSESAPARPLDTNA